MTKIRNRQDVSTDYPDVLETARAVRACKRMKITDLKSFVEACKASSSAERLGGLLIDMTTKSMISQVWDYIQKHEKAEELTSKLSNRFNNITFSHNRKVAILDLVDRFWKLAR
jgi:hypothetical protein